MAMQCLLLPHNTAIANGYRSTSFGMMALVFAVSQASSFYMGGLKIIKFQYVIYEVLYRLQVRIIKGFRRMLFDLTW